MQRRAVMPALLAVVALSPVVGGCTVRTAETQEVATVAGDRLFPGDRIEVTVAGEPDLSSIYELDRDGKIEMPLIGKLDAYSRTPEQVEAQVVAALADGFLVEPVVRVARVSPRPIFVYGGVLRPGSYPFRDGFTVEQAITVAGGAIGAADAYTIVVAPGGKASGARIVGLDATLVPGDVIELRERSG